MKAWNADTLARVLGLSDVAGICELTVDEAEWLLAEIGRRSGESSRYLEVGAGDGVFAAAVARRYPHVEVVCVDCFSAKEDSGTRPGKRKAFRENTAGLRNVTLCFGESQDVLPTLSPPYEVALIDAAHNQRAVFADAVRCWPLMDSGSLMVFHDVTSIPAVAKALNRFARENKLSILPGPVTMMSIAKP